MARCRSSPVVQIQTDGWAALGASRVGVSHVARGKGCEDRCAGAELGSGGMVLAVADGAGSAKRAAEGAEIAVAVAVDFVKSADVDWAALVAAVRDAMEAQGALEEFAATLLVVVVTDERIVTFQVGDGAIVVRGRDGGLRTLPAGAVAGEYVNETTFVTSARAMDEASVQELEAGEVTGIAMMTDGVEFAGVARWTREPHGPFFAPVFAFAAREGAAEAELGGLLEADWMNDVTDDDKTLVVAVRRGVAA